MDVLQRDLDMARQTWNLHKIRKVNNSEAPSGKPDMLFEMPEIFGGYKSHMLLLMKLHACTTFNLSTALFFIYIPLGGRKFTYPVNAQDVDNMEQFVSRPDRNIPQYNELFSNKIHQLGIEEPQTITEAALLYATLVDEFNLH